MSCYTSHWTIGIKSIKVLSPINCRTRTLQEAGVMLWSKRLGSTAAMVLLRFGRTDVVTIRRTPQHVYQYSSTLTGTKKATRPLFCCAKESTKSSLVLIGCGNNVLLRIHIDRGRYVRSDKVNALSTYHTSRIPSIVSWH